MAQDDRLDAMLAEWLSPDQVPPDPAFTRRTLKLVAAETALRRQRRRLVQDWLWQMAALASLVAGLALFSRLPILANLPRGGLLAIASPLALVLALWLFASGGNGAAAARRKPSR